MKRSRAQKSEITFPSRTGAYVVKSADGRSDLPKAIANATRGAEEIESLRRQLAGAVAALANLRQVAINGGAMEAGGGYDVTVLQPILRDQGGQ